MRALAVSCLALSLSACTYAALSPAGARVTPVFRDPGPECQNLGVITGKGGGGGGGFVPNESLVDYATNDALNRAAQRGATHLALSSPSLGYGAISATVTGIAYRCPEGAAPAPADGADGGWQRVPPPGGAAAGPVRGAP